MYWSFLVSFSERYLPKKEDFDRLILCFSDIEMGSGGIMDDFPHSDFFAELLDKYNDSYFLGTHVDLVFNGDTFDLLKTDFQGKYPRHIDKTVALGKFFKVAAAHPQFFEGVRKFLEFDQKNRRAIFITGNHDFELLFPEVQRVIRSACGFENEILFPGLSYEFGKVRVEHGSQHDTMFALDEQHPFVEYDGKKILNIPWGSVALLDVIIPLKDHFFHLDRLKPKDKVLEALPEFKEWLVSRLWNYYTKDYLKDFLHSSDPLKKVKWSMLKEVIRRFYTLHADVSINMSMKEELEKSDQFSLYLIGHQHETGWWSFGNRKIIQTGCFRNEFMIEGPDHEISRINKNYVEVFMKGERVVRSRIEEVDNPPLPENYVPMNVSEYREVIRNLLKSFSEEQQKNSESKQRKNTEVESTL
ncbi:MAG: hypothetical protein CL678_16200 [Bdellovibrionaceae bacterium]|nr:hypothetical protein [Pseudobdellovibrionaceae bacterium]